MAYTIFIGRLPVTMSFWLRYMALCISGKLAFSFQACV